MEPNQVANPYTLVEIQEVDAAAQQEVLAVIDGLRGIFTGAGNRVGRGASPQEGARLEKVHVETSAAQSGCRGEAGEAAARYENRTHQQPVWHVGQTIAFCRLPTAAPLFPFCSPSAIV